jgi:hypothetical protein
MPKVVAVHRLQLNAGADPAAFERVMNDDVFPGLNAVFRGDKMLSHAATKIGWLHSEHLLLRPGPQTDSTAHYLWMIIAPVDDSRLTSADNRHAVEQEAINKAQEFYTGGDGDTDAAAKIAPFAAWISLQTFIETASREFE